MQKLFTRLEKRDFSFVEKISCLVVARQSHVFVVKMFFMPSFLVSDYSSSKIYTTAKISHGSFCNPISICTAFLTIHIIKKEILTFLHSSILWTLNNSKAEHLIWSRMSSVNQNCMTNEYSDFVYLISLSGCIDLLQWHLCACECVNGHASLHCLLIGAPSKLLFSRRENKVFENYTHLSMH